VNRHFIIDLFWWLLSSTPIVNVAGCIKAFEDLPELQKTLLSWLMDLLIMVSQNSKENKMTTQNLGLYSFLLLFLPPPLIFPPIQILT
jgi:RhoGAP domain